MCLAEAIREERGRLSLSQEEFGSMICYSAKMVSAVEKGRRKTPEDAKPKLAAMSPRLALEICSECEVNIFPTDWLDGPVVDLSPLAVTEKLKEELAELLSALNRISLVNKTKPEHLTENDRVLMGEISQEVLDILLGGKIWLIKMALDYEIDLQEERKRHTDKLIRSKYIRVKRQKNKAVQAAK